jgi:DNA topoisomerase-1
MGATKRRAATRAIPLHPSALEKLKAPEHAAHIVGLRYVNDATPGLKRKRRGKSFCYLDEAGKRVRNEEHLARIRSLVIPPAWTDVWICAAANGHLQATGRDARGRKQYRYHPRWRTIRDATKYTQMIAFAEALPKIRRRVAKDLRLPHLSRNQVLATVVKLLETSLIRVGNEEYARDNKSYGLTTMRNRHVDVKGTRITFRFRGKSGKHHTVDVDDRRLAKVVSGCQDLPGQDLFQYVDDQGNPQNVNSEDVNAYLREISGAEFTAKDFRTWAGTVLAAMALGELEAADSHAQRKKNVVRAVESVAERLGNTPAVCRKCYVHPAIIDGYLEDATLAAANGGAAAKPSKRNRLRPEEAAVLALLRQHLAHGSLVSTNDSRPPRAGRKRAAPRTAVRSRRGRCGAIGIRSVTEKRQGGFPCNVSFWQ